MPDRKWFASGTAGLVTFALCLVASRYGITVPVDAQTSLVLVVGWVIHYFVPASKQDILKRLDDELVRIAQDDPRIPVSKP